MQKLPRIVTSQDHTDKKKIRRFNERRKLQV